LARRRCASCTTASIRGTRRTRPRAATLGLPDTAFVVGATGRLDPVKDLGTLIDAFARIAGELPESRLVLVGDGAERGALAAHARLRGVADRVLLTGQRSDARRLYGAFDAYVSSSTFEGVSLTILEAMAAARPIVATRVGGTPEVVHDRRTGWLVAPRDPAAIAARLLAIARDRADAAAVGRAARTRVLEHFTLDRMIDYYGAIYQALGAD
jgi:glycosyltransferase involved in cell wall biosynthesis